ncbi:TetR/AcrR family transcriptional regulator [Streptomyces spiralis]
MPTPEKTSLPRIVAAGRDLLEEHGPDGLTMQRVAARVGVRAPSLYKHVRDRAALVAAVAQDALETLGARLATTDGSLEQLVYGYRAFAHERPQCFRLLLGGLASPEALEQAAAPLLTASRELVGEEEALAAARLVTAWATGFIQMELAGAFRLGGDPEHAFTFGLTRLRRALADG